MAVFDDIGRDLDGPASATDTHFGYLNRSSRPEAEKVRQLIEAWIANYPAHDRPSLIGKLRSAIDNDHLSGFFELALHELLVSTGHRIAEIEPVVPHSPHRPDFLVEAPDGQRFYLEAVLATGKSDKETAAAARMNKAIRVVEEANSPEHFLDLSMEGKPDKPVSEGKLRRGLAKWVAGLPATDDAAKSDPFIYEEHGLKFTVRAIPRKKKTGKPHRPLGIQFMEPFWAEPGGGLREKLEKKAKRYGDLGLPYVVAVNGLAVHHDERHAMDALFGSPCVVITTYEDGTREDRPSRMPNGVWSGKRGPRNQGVSAVLSVDHLGPFNVASRRLRLIRCPWGAPALPPIPLGVDELNPDKGQMPKTLGRTFGELVGLPVGWPGS